MLLSIAAGMMLLVLLAAVLRLGAAGRCAGLFYACMDCYLYISPLSSLPLSSFQSYSASLFISVSIYSSIYGLLVPSVHRLPPGHRPGGLASAGPQESAPRGPKTRTLSTNTLFICLCFHFCMCPAFLSMCIVLDRLIVNLFWPCSMKLLLT